MRLTAYLLPSVIFRALKTCPKAPSPISSTWSNVCKKAPSTSPRGDPDRRERPDACDNNALSDACDAREAEPPSDPPEDEEVDEVEKVDEVDEIYLDGDGKIAEAEGACG